MKKIFSNYYKIILSVVILIVLVALGEDYYTFDEMGGIWQVVRVQYVLKMENELYMVMEQMNV